MKFYYYVENDQRFGPFSLEELATKRLTKQTLVWMEGLTDWTLADQIEELKQIVVSEPPPIPQSKELKNDPIAYNDKQSNSISFNKHYDTYTKETEASIYGMLLLIISITLPALSNKLISPEVDRVSIRAAMGLVSLLIRFISSSWASNIASRQNRNTSAWSIAAFLFPSFTMIILGLLNKRKLRIEVNHKHTPEQQADSLYKIASKFLLAERYFESLEVVSKAIELDSNNLDCKRIRAISNVHLGDYLDAKSDFENLKENKYNIPETEYYLGIIELHTGDKNVAIDHWLSALKSNFDPAKIKLDNYFNFSEVYLLKQNEVFRKVSSKGINNYKLYIRGKYLGGILEIDKTVNLLSCKFQLFLYDLGIHLMIESGFNNYNLGISYTEINRFSLMKNKSEIQFQLSNSYSIFLNYGRTVSSEDAVRSDLEDDVRKLCGDFERATGRKVEVHYATLD